MKPRHIHIALLISALLCGGGALYAGEGRVLASPGDESAVPAIAPLSFSALQFEIDFVDAFLSPLPGAARRSDSRFLRAPTRLMAVSSIEAAKSANSGGAADFWERFDAMAGQQLALVEREERLLGGSISSIIERRDEIRSASPLRDLRGGGAGGEHSAARTSASNYAPPVVVTGRRLAPAAASEAVPSGLRRAVDVRAGLYLHAIRNGSLSGGHDHNNSRSYASISSPASPRFALRSLSLFVLSFLALSSLTSLSNSAVSIRRAASPVAALQSFAAAQRRLVSSWFFKFPGVSV